MFFSIVKSFLLAVSLSADCFAVSTCSSVTLGKVSWKNVILVALAFGFVQTGLMVAGWALGDIFVGYVHKAARLIGFLLLLYVGGSMILEAAKSKCQTRNLSGFKNVIISAVATSIDALGVGVSLSMSQTPGSDMALNSVSLFIVTALSVVGGMFGGQKIGMRFGRPAAIIGGVILILIGINILTDFI